MPPAVVQIGPVASPDPLKMKFQQILAEMAVMKDRPPICRVLFQRNLSSGSRFTGKKYRGTKALNEMVTDIAAAGGGGV